jgi:hypothetical protein
MQVTPRSGWARPNAAGGISHSGETRCAKARSRLGRQNVGHNRFVPHGESDPPASAVQHRAAIRYALKDAEPHNLAVPSALQHTTDRPAGHSDAYQLVVTHQCQCPQAALRHIVVPVVLLHELPSLPQRNRPNEQVI